VLRFAPSPRQEKKKIFAIIIIRRIKQMKQIYTIPYHSKNESTHKETIYQTIKILSDQYLIDFNYMNTQKRIEWLETITNLVDIYLNMEGERIDE
jgi:HJR/Mrr/RecB family endonuclease